jgi:hypothetical protein
LGRDRGRSGMSKRARLKDGPRISHGNKAVAAVRDFEQIVPRTRIPSRPIGSVARAQNLACLSDRDKNSLSVCQTI